MNQINSKSKLQNERKPHIKPATPSKHRTDVASLDIEWIDRQDSEAFDFMEQSIYSIVIGIGVGLIIGLLAFAFLVWTKAPICS